MHSRWTWLSGICRQRRILIILCTFGSTFIAFNYSLLSSSSTNPSLSSFTNLRTVDDGSFNNIQHRKHAEHDHNPKDKHRLSFEMPVPSSKPTLSVSISGLSRRRKISTKLKEDSLSSLIKEENIRNQVSPLKVVDSSILSKHAQKSFTSHPNRANRKQSNVEVVDSGRSNMIDSLQAVNSRVNFLNYTEQGSDFNEKNDRIRSNSYSSKIVRHISANKIIDGNAETDQMSRQTKAASLSSITTPSEIKESNISTNRGKRNKIDAVTPDFPILSNSIHSSSSRLFLHETTPLESSSSPQPQRQHVAFYKSSSSNTTSTSTSNNSNNPFFTSLRVAGSTKSNLLSPFNIPPCNTTFQLRRVQKRKKNLTVIENFITGWKHVRCNETITYTTHADYRYFDNLVPLVDRWNGPVSLSIYCPGEDLEESLKLISYLKLCTTSNIDKWVTFHLIYDTKYMKRPPRNYTKPGDIPWLDILYQQGKWKDCSQKPNFSKGTSTFRIQNGLLYPINIVRNIARSAATTYFVLTSDIELYPSINLIPSFMEMLGRLQREEDEINYYTKKNKFTAAAAALVAKILFSESSTNQSGNENAEHTPESSSKPLQNEIYQQHRPSDIHRRNQSRHVFVLPVFEVKKEILPCQVETKEQLVSLLKYRAAVLFHHSICPQCHTFPKYEEWKTLYPTTGGALEDYRNYNCTTRNSSSVTNQEQAPLRIFHKAKRKRQFSLWEPIFIGTKDEPIYDERLSWEGLRDKMVSGYVMCALDYDFYILDNAFLVHKPGIRRVNHLVTKTVMSQDRLINYRIRSELLKKFGQHGECAL